MRLLTRRPDHISSPVLALTALLAAVLLFTVSSVAFPSDVLGASTLATTCDGVALRTKPSTSSTRKAILPAGVQVNAVTKVTGGSWRHTCNDRVTSGNTWYRINNVKGGSASSRYGVTYVYAVTAAFKSVPITTRYTTCDDVGLRTKPSTSATRKASLPDDVKVASVARVSGGSWRSTCNGTTTTGSSWYRITAVKGESVTSRYGVTYVYAATAKFSTVAPGATTPPPSTSVRVSSIPALLSALDNNSVTNIVVANGRYRVSPAGSRRSDSLWIGAKFADRTRAVTVRAETRGGVTFDGGGSTYFGGLSFEAGAHDQTWDGFNFANGEATSTGIITFGGYAGLAPPHHITLRHIRLLSSLTGRNAQNDHGIYVSQASNPGPHDILFEDITVDGTGATPLSSALHFYHHDATNPNASNVTVRRLKVTGTHTAIFIWDSSVRYLTIEDSTLTNARIFGIRYEQPGQNIVLRNIVTTGSGQQGFYSSLGTNPPGVTFVNNSFR